MMRGMRTGFRARWWAITLATLLAGCGAAATPSPSVVAEPTPTPGPPTAGEVIASFLTLTGDPKLTMHVVEDGKVTVTAAGTTDDVKIGLDMDVNGADGIGSAVVDTGPANVTFKMLLAKDHAYVDDNGTWTAVPNDRPTTPLNP